MLHFLPPIGRPLRHLLRDRRGNVAVIFGLALLPMAGAAGVAVDYGRASSSRERLQVALDGAVLAGASKPADQRVALATSFFTTNYNGLGTPVASFETGSDGAFAGTASVDVPTTITQLLNVDSISVGAAAAAQPVGTSSYVCILLVDPTASQSLLVNSGAKVTAPECELHVRSTGNPAAMINNGQSLDLKKICVKGSNVTVNNGVKAPLEKSCDAIADPFAGKMPAVTVPTACTSGKNYNSDVSTVTWSGNLCSSNFNNQATINLGPGMYQNINFNGSPTINLSPGLYVIKGTVIVNSGAKMKGEGVTFYFADANSKIQFNGNVTLTVSAPTSGDYANILFFEPALTQKSQYVVNGTAGSTINGLMYLPSRNVTINSVSNVTANAVTMVFDTLILNSTDWKFTSSPKSMPAGTANGGGGVVRLIR
jgi:Flp pilus assembly protein TadG